MLDFLLVIPTRNEEKYIMEVVKKADHILSRHYIHYKIVVADGSSQDGTVGLVKKAMRQMPSLDLMANGESMERGTRIMRSFSKYNSKFYCSLDADMAPSLGALDDILEREIGKYDAVIGSRYAKPHLTIRPKLRMFVSRAYNSTVNILFHDGIMDHQCGLKIFDFKALGELKAHSRERHWAWDTEAILIVRRAGLKMHEVPVYWIERRNKKIDIRRLLVDIVIFLPAIARMYYNINFK